jgi:hypothetical protein
MKKMIAQVMMRMQVLVKMKIRKHQEEKMIVGMNLLVKMKAEVMKKIHLQVVKTNQVAIKREAPSGS